MKTFRNIYLLGSSHVASESIRQVKQNIEKIAPDIIALELDSGRAYALKHKVKRQKNIDLVKILGLPGFLFYLFGEFIQRKLGKIMNISPGSEMLTAIRLAEEKKLPVFFIDREIQITLSRFSKHVKKREILKMFFDVVFGFFKKEKVKIDLSKLPSEELISFVLSETKERYPSFYKILIYERDRFMANKLYALSSSFPDKKIFAVSGAGHSKGILNYLEQISKQEHKFT